MEAAALDLREKDGAVLVPLLVQPGASRDAVVGIREGALRLRIQAPPSEGQANDRCLWFVARVLLKCSASQVTLESGHRSRHKVVRVAGIPLGSVTSLLREALPEVAPPDL